MSFLPPGVLTVAALVLLYPARSAALEVRNYSQASHNRLLEFPGAPIIPSWTVYVNPTYTPDAGLFLGVCWPVHPTDWTRQMALVSPRHFVCASHYPLGMDWTIAFLGTDGAQHLIQGLQSQTPVVDSQGHPTDLTLCTLAAPVPAGFGIAPFPVLNLPSEADYLGRQMIVCGSFVRTGRMPLAGFVTQAVNPGVDTTRLLRFDYNTISGGPDDCHYEGGDSGAPSFVMVDGKPALVGTASDETTFPDGISRNLASFVPAYLPQLDALMEAQGYHIKRFYPAATPLVLQLPAGPPLRRGQPGSALLDVANLVAQAAHNVALRITFSTAPQSLAGTGWVCVPASATVWDCRRGGIGGNGQSSLSATWGNLPNAAEIHATVLQTCDGAAPQTIEAALPLIESYASWSQGLADTSGSADPDRDGIPNLLEYAFGGSPSQASVTAPGGRSLIPRSIRSGANLLVTYPRRTDAATRGISDGVEFSSSLTNGSWSATPPAGTTTQSAPYVPASPGFEQVTVSVPINAARCFARVKVTLAE